MEYSAGGNLDDFFKIQRRREHEIKRLFLQLVKGVSVSCEALFVRVFGLSDRTRRLLDVETKSSVTFTVRAVHIRGNCTAGEWAEKTDEKNAAADLGHEATDTP